MTAFDESFGGNFGFAVAIDGDIVVIGAPGVDTAYVILRAGTTWNNVARITASDGNPGDGFGFTVSVNEDTVVVGAPYYESNDCDSGRRTWNVCDFGSVYLYEPLEYGRKRES